MQLFQMKKNHLNTNYNQNIDKLLKFLCPKTGFRLR